MRNKSATDQWVKTTTVTELKSTMGKFELNNFRQNSDPGEWCAFLVPLCFFVSCLMNNYTLQVQDVLVLTLSAFLTMSSLSLWYRIKRDVNNNLVKTPLEKKKSQRQKEPANALYPLALLGLSLIVVFMVSGLNLSSLITVLGYVAYRKYLPMLFSKFPGSFTFGEGCMALQATTLFVVHTLTKLMNHVYHPMYTNESFVLIAQIILLSEGLLFVSPSIPGLSWTKCPTFFYAASIVLGGSLTFPMLTRILRMDPISFVVSYIISSKSVVKLVLLWLLLVIFALDIVRKKLDASSKATTSERKLFHALVVIVMVSGLHMDPEFTNFASLVVLAAFIYVEYIRSYDIRPISKLINGAFAKFTDEKDQGSLVLTNIYLLIGTFLPLWITPEAKSVNKLILLSGVLSIGIGDSAASIVGSRMGHLKWPYSPTKSIEGTAASIIAQLVFLQLLFLNNFMEYQFGLGVLLPVILTALLEAHTTQVDNIILPLTMYFLFNVML